MAIKKGENITATDISTLKQKVIEIYQKRPFLSNAGYSVTSISADGTGFGSTAEDRNITQGNKINQNFYYALNALLQLNNIQDITSENTTGDYIFKYSNTEQDLLTVVNTWHGLSRATTSQPASCRGGCVGLCWNSCDETCKFDCLSGTFGEAGGTGNDGYPGQDQSCGTNCTSNCGGTCSNACKGECKNGCLHTCSTGCGSGCGKQCAGGCKDGCKGCGTECSMGCSSGCGDDCDTNCAVGCRTNPGRL